jgi:hypothetical protein
MPSFEGGDKFLKKSWNFCLGFHEGDFAPAAAVIFEYDKIARFR